MSKLLTKRKGELYNGEEKDNSVSTFSNINNVNVYDI